MHVHGSQMNLNPVNPYSAAAEKAVAAQRAADVRKKLLQSGTAIAGEPSPEEALMIAQWMNSGQSQIQHEDQYHPSASGKVPDFG